MRLWYLLVLLLLMSCSDRRAWPHEGQFAGTYYLRFERSDFRPTGTKETWWFQGKVPCTPDPASNRPYSLVYIEVHATLSDEGSFGHLGSYSRQITPTQFVVCREATAAETQALFADGSFPR